MFFYYWLVFMVPMPDYRAWAYQVGPLTVIKCVGVLCLAAALVRLATKGYVPPFYRRPAAWCSLIYLFVAFTGYSLRDLSGLGVEGLTKILAVLSLLIVTLIMVDSQERFRRVILVAIAGEAICSLYVVRQWITFRYIYSEFRSFGGLTDDSNYFAISVVLWLPVTFMCISRERPRLERMFCLGCALAMLAGFVVSGSRGGLLGLALASLVLILRSRRPARNLFLAGTLALVLLSASVFSSSSAVSRLLHPSPGDVSSTQARLALWKAGLRSVEQHPVLGVGSSAFTIVLSRDAHYNVSHNTYLDILGQLGLAGFVPFMGILIFAYRDLKSVADVRNHPPPLMRRVAIGFQAGLAGYVVGAFFLSTWWQQVLWLLIFLSMCVTWLQHFAAEEPRAATRGFRRSSESGDGRGELVSASNSKPSNLRRNAVPSSEPRGLGGGRR